MKYILLLFSLFVASWVKGQGHYDGQLSLGINGGLQTDKALVFNLHAQKLFKGNYFGLRGDLMFSTTNREMVVIIPQTMKYTTYTAGISGLYTFEQFISYPFYINLFLGGNYTNEVLNNKINTSEQGITFDLPKQHVMGLYGGVEFEYMFHRQFSVVLTSMNQYQINSDLDKMRVSGLIGVKYSF